jgi:type VI secretion system protein ImpL
MKRILFSWWTLTILAALLMGLALTVALPFVLHFLRPWWIRLLLGFVVFGVWALFAVLRLLKARKAAASIATALARTDPGDVEAKALATRMDQALATLKASAGRNRDYLYTRPWYVIIGPPGAGKTTALLNSGLRFPFEETALKGVGGTRNLDFWFADEAVMVDTAGRYTTQDSDAAVDRKGWDSFLHQLRKVRPLQPINGVLIAIGVDQLLTTDQAGLDAHAAAVRRRVMELRQTLEVSAPVYVLFTKADLLAGFGEYFDDLDVEGRRAVLGSTLIADQPIDAAAFASAFDGMAHSVSARSAKRLQEEADLRRRSLILGFPSQVDAIRARVLRFLDGAFPQGDPSTAASVRGFYFTSGVQDGAPLDRLLSGIATVYAEPTPAAPGRGRAYFLNRLLHEVVFAEAGLVRSDARATGRRRTAILSGLAGAAAVVMLALVFWTVSFVGNRGFQDNLRAAAASSQAEARTTGLDLLEVKQTDPDLEQALAYLDQLRALPGGYDQRRTGGAPLLQRFGLYQAGHSRAAEDAYHTGLRRVLLPRLILRLESYVQAHLTDPLPLYEALKVYLMLGGQQPGELDAEAVKAWVKADWEREILAGADRAEVRKGLERHLDALLADDQIGAEWPSRTAPLDGSLIQAARAQVQTLTPAQRAYAVLKQRAATQGTAWRANTILNAADAPAFANGPAVLNLTVPYLFTRQGYERAYLPGLVRIQTDLQRDQWVLGEQGRAANAQTRMGDLQAGVARAYAGDYIAAWKGVLDQLQPGSFFRDPVAFGAFTREPSPLKAILQEVRKNTTFTGGAQAAVAAAGQAAQRGIANKLVPSAVRGSTGGSGGGGGSSRPDAGREIQAFFTPLHQDLGGANAPGRIDALVDAVRAAGAATTAAGYAGGGAGGEAVQAQVATSMGAVGVAASGLSPLLQPFGQAVASGGGQARAASASGAVADAYMRTLLPSCRAVTEQRYPFEADAQNDASTADLIRVFGLNGEIDSFARTRLEPLLDRSGAVWRWRADDPVAAAFDPSSADPFRRAALIRDLLTEGLQMRIEGAGFGGAVTAAEITVGASTYRFEPGSAGQRAAIWTLNSVPEARVTLFTSSGEVTFEHQGPWAFFELMDESRKANDGPTAVKATFGEGGAFATFRIIMPPNRNPFRGGLWAFRCPPSL